MITNQNTLTVAKPLADVKGMLTVKSAKTGATKIQLMSKRDFTTRWIANSDNAGKPKKQAARDFEAYRVASLDAFNAQVGQAFASGAIRAERITADKSGDLRTISLMRRNTREQDTKMHYLRETSRITGIPLDVLVADAKKNAPGEIDGAALDVTATEVATPSVETKTEPAQPAEQNAPVSVAAAA